MGRKRPRLVTALSCLLIVTGAAGMIIHAREVTHGGVADVALVEGISALAIVAGTFMLRGNNWARWLAMLWIGAHVVISAFHPLREFAIHVVIFCLFAIVLFRQAANSFFRTPELS